MHWVLINKCTLSLWQNIVHFSPTGLAGRATDHTEYPQSLSRYSPWGINYYQCALEHSRHSKVYYVSSQTSEQNTIFLRKTLGGPSQNLANREEREDSAVCWVKTCSLWQNIVHFSPTGIAGRATRPDRIPTEFVKVLTLRDQILSMCNRVTNDPFNEEYIFMDFINPSI